LQGVNILTLLFFYQIDQTCCLQIE
jgi:hypothetical protein